MSEGPEDRYCDAVYQHTCAIEETDRGSDTPSLLVKGFGHKELTTVGLCKQQISNKL